MKNKHVSSSHSVVPHLLRVLRNTVLTLVGICLYSQNIRAVSATNAVPQKEVLIPSGRFEMGDHFGYVDPGHPSDETPVHSVELDSFYIANTETTNAGFVAFLQSAYRQGLLREASGVVRLKSDTTVLCYTSDYAPYYSIRFVADSFVVDDARAQHPVVGVMWTGAALYCNWLSQQSHRSACYTVGTWTCDATLSGYRLPTEAEWEYAARGGHTAPYYNYPWGNDRDARKANWPQSGDPFESGALPQTTPVGFYDGSLRIKSDYNWPATMSSYQTHDGANSWGLYDMAGNVWEFVNDWYGQDYYSKSPVYNPPGPVTGFIMPDGRAYRGMRGGNWYNGDVLDSVNDGHSRVSNRNPSYYRGPQDPNHPWYHVGFRIARSALKVTTGVENEERLYADVNTPLILQASPSPVQTQARIVVGAAQQTPFRLTLVDVVGRTVCAIAEGQLAVGEQSFFLDATALANGWYCCILQSPMGTRCCLMLVHH